MTRKNAYPGACSICGVTVDANAGYLYNDRGWKVCCTSIVCAAKAGIDTTPPKRTVDEHGVVRMPKDYDALPVLRAAGSWNKDAMVWQLDIGTPETLTRAIEAAESLGLDGVDLLRARLGESQAAIRDRVEAARKRAEASPAYDYQRHGIEWLASRQRALLGDDMGLGKTIQVLIAAPEDARMIVVAPKSLGPNWAKEVAKWRPDLTAVRCAKWQDLRAPDPGEVVITHYECLRSLQTAVKGGKTYSTANQAYSKGTVARALDTTGCILVSDEAHRLKNPKAALTKAWREAMPAASAVWVATGTPMLGHPLELWHVLESAGLGKLAFGGYRSFYGSFGGYQEQVARGVTVTRFAGPDKTVPGKLARVMLRRTKQDALPGLPRKNYVTLTINDLKAGLLKKLDKIGKKHANLLEAGKLPPFEALSECRKLLADSRIAAAEEWADDREDAGEPVLVFSAHRAPVEALGAREGWAQITGDTSADERQRIVDAFQDGQLKGVALTIGAGREGLTLTAASTILFIDLDWTPALNAQAEDRICRIGQRADRCTIVRMVSSHPVDIRVQELLTEKSELFDSVIEAATKADASELEALPGYGQREADIWTEETEAEWQARVQAAESARDQQARKRLVDEARSKTAQVVRRRSLPTREYPQSQVMAMEYACRYLAAACDGAITQDGQGFNKVDAAYGHWFAATGFAHVPDAQTLAYDILRKYKRQLPEKVYADIYTDQPHLDAPQAVHVTHPSA